VISAPSGPARRDTPCDAAPDRAFELVDGALDLASAAALAEHLRGCVRCRRTVADARGLRAVLARQSTAAPAAPARLRARVAELLAEPVPAAAARRGTRSGG
jgi:anti-sigma factor RsiW